MWNDRQAIKQTKQTKNEEIEREREKKGKQNKTKQKRTTDQPKFICCYSGTKQIRFCCVTDAAAAAMFTRFNADHSLSCSLLSLVVRNSDIGFTVCPLHTQ